jgi:hypothetical protein
VTAIPWSPGSSSRRARFPGAVTRRHQAGLSSRLP